MKLLLMVMSLFLCLTAHAQIFDVPHGRDTPTRILLIPASAPKAIVLLFPGGGGMLRLQNDGSSTNDHTFVRSKKMWAQYGISGVLVDSPDNLGNTRSNARYGNDHLQRMHEVVLYVKRKFNLPIWLFGHSMGTTSLTAFANQGNAWNKDLAGLIFAGTHISARLNSDITLPTLAIRHLLDDCQNTPNSSSREIIETRTKGVRAQLSIIEGGENSGASCTSTSHHGFNKQEAVLIETAATFILADKQNEPIR